MKKNKDNSRNILNNLKKKKIKKMLINIKKNFFNFSLIDFVKFFKNFDSLSNLIYKKRKISNIKSKIIFFLKKKLFF